MSRQVLVEWESETELRFTHPYDRALFARLSHMFGKRFSFERKMWIVPNTEEAIASLRTVLTGYKVRVDSSLMKQRPAQWSWANGFEQIEEEAAGSALNGRAKQAFVDHLRVRGYSPKIIRTYTGQLVRFFRYVSERSAVWDENILKGYSLYLLEKGHSHADVNQAISAVHFYCKHVLMTEVTISYIRPKKEKKLPNVMSASEVLRLFKAVTNRKHKARLYLTYSSGLRVSEVVRLRLSDVDPERHTVHVRQGKGRKDRITHAQHRRFSSRVFGRRTSKSRSASIPCAIPLQPTCLRTEPTCAIYKLCLDIKAYAPPSGTPTSPQAACTASKAHLTASCRMTRAIKTLRKYP